MKNNTSITVWKKSFGTYYYVERYVTNATIFELKGILDLMDEELCNKIKDENTRKPKLPK